MSNTVDTAFDFTDLSIVSEYCSCGSPDPLNSHTEGCGKALKEIIRLRVANAENALERARRCLRVELEVARVHSGGVTVKLALVGLIGGEEVYRAPVERRLSEGQSLRLEPNIEVSDE